MRDTILNRERKKTVVSCENRCSKQGPKKEKNDLRNTEKNQWSKQKPPMRRKGSTMKRERINDKERNLGTLLEP